MGGHYELRWHGHRLDLGEKTHIMGILNVTPDSFSDGGLFYQREKAIEHGKAMARDGADIIDVGGESTRPYSERTSPSDELERVIPVIQTLKQETDKLISIDTYRSEVAEKALEAGASIINDISALREDPRMVSVAASAGVPVILMHMKGTPENMQKNPTYHDLIPEIRDFLKDAVQRAVTGGIREDLIVVDPGIGFGKSFDHNLQIIQALDQFHTIRRPLLLGTSRKAFIGHILDRDPLERDTGTMATVVAGILKDAHIVRVHNVRMAIDAVRMADAIKKA